MKLSTVNRRARTGAVRHFELLETRCLLSATVLASVPTQNLVTSSGEIAQFALSGYLGDPSLTGGTVVEMQTPLGNIPFQLFDSQTPNTVANFETYINNGAYQPTIIQRSLAGFVLQGGGTKPDGSNIPAQGTLNSTGGTVNGEPGISNTVGTLAMALSDGPNSATNQWFINLGDNSALDGTQDGGPFTVFGTAIDNGLSVANAIAALPTVDGAAENSNWFIPNGGGALPVLNTYTGPTTLTAGNPINPQFLVTDNVVTIPAGQQVTYSAVSNNPSLVTASVTNGLLTLSAAPGVTSGLTSVTATVTDLSGQTASTTFTVGINLVGTTTSVSPSAPTAIVGTPVTLTATVAPASSGAPPTGTVTFVSGSTQIGSPVAVSGDTAVLQTASLPAGVVSITADYSGDSNYLPSTSTAFSESIITPTLTDTLTGPASTTIVATTSTAVARLREKLTLTASNGATTGPAHATIQLSPNESASSSVFTLATANTHVRLKAGKADNLVLRLAKTIPSTVPAGTYHVLITATDTAGNVVTTDSGQTITVVAPEVDLSGSIVGPATAKAGRKTAFTFEVTNASSANVSAAALLPIDIGTSPDGLLDDASLLSSTMKRINLRPGGRTRITVFATLSSSTFLVIDLDPQKTVFPNDTNTANNAFSKQIAVM